MTIENIIQSEIDTLRSGIVFNKTLTLSGVEASNAISIPEITIDGIGVQIETDGVANVYVTCGTPAQIEADSCMWELWNGSSLFNKAITAIYVDNLSGDSAICISVRGS